MYLDVIIDCKWRPLGRPYGLIASIPLYEIAKNWPKTPEPVGVSLKGGTPKTRQNDHS